MSYAMANEASRPPLLEENELKFSSVQGAERSAGERNRFPEITRGQGKVDAKAHVAEGTNSAVVPAFVLAILGTLLGILFSYGILLVVLLAYPLFAWYIH